MTTIHIIRNAYSWPLCQALFNGLPLFIVIFVLKATVASTSLKIHRLIVTNRFRVARCRYWGLT